jgi:hypothetical protein
MTASGMSNAVPFSYSIPSSSKNVHLVPSGDLRVLIFSELQEISNDSTNVVAKITIENITGAWYVVHVQAVGGVAGMDLPAGDFMMGPCDLSVTSLSCDEISLGSARFPQQARRRVTPTIPRTMRGEHRDFLHRNK